MFEKKQSASLRDTVNRRQGRGVTSLLGVLVLFVGVAACDSDSGSKPYERVAKDGAKAKQEWRHYLGDKKYSHASPLAQVNRSNVRDLVEVWRYDARGAADDGSTQMQCSPLVVRGILYCTSPLLHVFALDASTGEELWRFDPSRSLGLLPNPNRGLTYWEKNTDGSGDKRILYTAGSYLYALDARTGAPISDFGDGGKVDLHVGLPDQFSDTAVIATTPGSIFEDLLIIGSRVEEYKGAAPGHIRAFDVVSGELRWVFHTIPRPGEFGSDTWPPGSFGSAGGANSWAGIAIDEERGLAFVPTGSPSFDFYGDDRHGDNLFANSLVALNAATGERVWHYQFVRHDLWDRDLPSPPNLITLSRDGNNIPAVAQATKTGHLFVFNRETGEPLFPIREEPVVGKAVTGERPAISQPLPVMPPPYAQQVFVPSDRTLSAQRAVKMRTDNLDQGSVFMVPGTQGMVLYPGMDGGAEWGGAAWDQSSEVLYINSNEVPYLLQLTAVPKDLGMGPEVGYLALCAGCHGADLRGDGVSVPGLQQLSDRMSPFEAYRIVSEGRGRMPAFGQIPWYARAAILWHVYTADQKGPEGQGAKVAVASESSFLNAGFQKLTDPEGFPASRPPWGTLTAINLSRAEILWQIPLGDYPRMLEQGKSGLGAENYGGAIVTAGDLLFIAATPDRVIRALDKHSGEELWQAALPAAGFATPITYAVDGKQYIVIAAGGGKLGQPSGSSYVAYALPE
ncbi:pyrroloquinoline quinone-dependent dehydrogenase [Halieaceae bacterium IMCC11814]|uniref:Pyrroloquinoline quinone-dependent dehydrogenase n=1 Tax=Candidatus Marimicrobium litorale TaxID=2518991 RepID=A0ABT3T833_9GAMM|nr:pyrroloquinoline quinone-dependent dehydrogenase [Candidatus Marimicrobium litorale]